MTISELIKNYRINRNESVNSLARALDITPSTLNRIENGETKKIDFEFVIKVVNYLKIPKIEILALLNREEDCMILAELIKSKRLDKKYSIEDLSKLTGLTTQEVIDIEDGKIRDISFRLISRLKYILAFTEEEVTSAIEGTFLECNKIENMDVHTIEGSCSVCNFKYDVKEVSVGHNNQLTCFYLCKNCREKLSKLLIK